MLSWYLLKKVNKKKVYNLANENILLLINKMATYTYDGQFIGNILLVGRTGCVKTSFIQKLGRNNLFGKKIRDVYWISKIALSSEREDNIKESFIDRKVHFSYPEDLDEFNYLIELLSQNKSEYIENDLGENIEMNKLIIMDNVSGLADKSQEFSNIPHEMIFHVSMYFKKFIQRDKIGE